MASPTIPSDAMMKGQRIFRLEPMMTPTEDQAEHDVCVTLLQENRSIERSCVGFWGRQIKSLI